MLEFFHMKSSVIGIIFNTPRDKVLVLKRRDVPVWVLPGGGIEQGENAEQAVIREVLEETGLQVKIERKVAEYTPINKLADYTHVFECAFTGGAASTGNETQDIGFYPISTLPEPFFFIHQDWIADALKNESKIIKKSLDKVTYINLLLYFIKHPLRVLRFAMSRLGMPLNNKMDK